MPEGAAAGVGDMPEMPDIEGMLPEGVDFDEFMDNVTKMAQIFMQKERFGNFSSQYLVLFGFLLIPVSLLLICFCRIISLQRKKYGKEKKQKEPKKELKKKV